MTTAFAVSVATPLASPPLFLAFSRPTTKPPLEIDLAEDFESDDAAMWLRLDFELSPAELESLDHAVRDWADGIASQGDLVRLYPQVQFYQATDSYWRRYCIDFGYWASNRPRVWAALRRHLAPFVAVTSVHVETDALSARSGLARELGLGVNLPAPPAEEFAEADEVQPQALETARKLCLSDQILAILAQDGIATNRSAVKVLSKRVGKTMFKVACALDELRDYELIDDDGDQYEIIHSIWILPAGRRELAQLAAN